MQWRKTRPVTLSEAKGLHHRNKEILRYAQNDGQPSGRLLRYCEIMKHVHNRSVANNHELPNLSGLTDRRYLSSQYKNGSNLNARIRLHDRFSINKVGWHAWVFGQLDLPPKSRVLENGLDQISRWFSKVTLRRYEDGLVITEADPLVAYVLSTRTKSVLVGDRLAEFVRFVEQELADQGTIYVTKDSGVFEAL